MSPDDHVGRPLRTFTAGMALGCLVVLPLIVLVAVTGAVWLSAPWAMAVIAFVAPAIRRHSKGATRLSERE